MVLRQNLGHTRSKGMSCDFAVTFTLNPKFRPDLYSMNAEQQFRSTADCLVSLFANFAKMTIVAEITSTYNVHYHGYMRFDLAHCVSDPQKKFWDTLRTQKMFGNTAKTACVKQVEDHGLWLKYLLKDLQRTRSIIKNDPVVIDDFNYIKTKYLESKVEAMPLLTESGDSK